MKLHIASPNEEYKTKTSVHLTVARPANSGPAHFNSAPHKDGEGRVFMLYISLFLIVWLAAGFAVGMKQVYVDQLFDKDVIERLEKEAGDHDLVVRFIKHRFVYIAAVTLSGFIAVYSEIKAIPQKRSIRKIEKDINKLNKVRKRGNNRK